MRFVVTSDLHLGALHCQAGMFREFLDCLPADGVLVLNGDTFDGPGETLPAEHVEVLSVLCERAARVPVILIPGNHDMDVSGLDLGDIRVAGEFCIGDRFLAVHGNELDYVMPAHRSFIRWFRWFHALRVSFGARDVHVAQYAKRWSLLYSVLVKRQREQASRCARRRGVSAIACGHVHYAEDSVVDGIRYLNTGAWTEEPVYCVAGDDQRIEFVDVGRVLNCRSWERFPRVPALSRNGEC